MKRDTFNHDWLFFHGNGTALERTVSGSEEPQSVTLPHDAMIREERDPNHETGNATGYYPCQTVHYIKEFKVEDKSGAAYLEFEGIYKNAAVFLNDCLIAQHSNGYTPLTIDVSNFLKQGDNRIKVLVRNEVPSSRWYTGTGIYRDTWLYTGKPVHIIPHGIKIRTLSVDSDIAALMIDTTVFNQTSQQHEVILRHRIGGAEIEAPVTMLPYEKKTISLRFYLDNPELWNENHPFLYNCESELVGWDTECTRFGIRTLSLDSMHGLRINCQSVKLRGGCIHQDHGVIGAVEHRDLTYRRIRKLKEAGYNAVRCAHFPTSQTVLDACDEYGMFVMLDFCDAWTTPKVAFDYSTEFLEHSQKDIIAMVDSAYNHPSVIIYAIGNEIGEVSNPHEAQYGRKLCDTIRSIDSTRFITNCVNIALALMDRIPSLAVKAGADINSIMNGNAEELARLMSSKEIGEPLEEAFSYLDIAGYNYATYRYETDTKLYPHRMILGTECYPGALYENWELCKKLPQVIGDFGWAAWDYLGEAGVGQHRYGEAIDYDLYGPYPWRTANCGDFDLIGDRRPVSYWRQIVWGERKEPYIAVQSPAHYGEKQSPTRWGWSDAERCWNYRGYENKPIVVEVYSDAEEVQLSCNGKEIGRQRPIKCKAIFHTTFEPGELVAVNIRNGIQEESDRISTASYKVHIQKRTVGEGVTELSVVDDHGELNPDVTLSLTASCEGDLTILGFGTADPKSEENYFDSTIKTFRGKALIVTQGTGELIIKEN